MIFKDERLDKKLNRQGYVVLDLLTTHEVSVLKDFFDKHYAVELNGFHSTHFIADRELKQQVHDLIVSVMESKLQKFIPDYYAVFGNYMVKALGNYSRMPLHADWTYVDEGKSVSLGIWCPLVDTDENNGRLGVVPKSHTLRKNLRGPQVPTPFHHLADFIIEEYGKFLSMKAGSCVVYDHRLLHFSNANHSKKLRPAVNLVLAPKNQQLYHYANRASYPKLEKYLPQDSSFYINYEHFEIPDSACEGLVEDPWKAFSQEYVETKLSTSIWEKVTRFFNP
jgi:ectoine hydroxylase-related dioxygenase (phytanoyl-CoA dioxygenase family)